MAVENGITQTLHGNLPIFNFGKYERQVNTKSFEQKYSMFIQNGGVIGRCFMRDASKLNKKEIQKKYPRNELYLEDPEEQIDYIEGRTKIKLTAEQRALYYNLRWIPVETPQVIEIPNSEESGMKAEYLHPKDLDEIGLLSQVLKFTEDINREFLLRKYCQIYKSFPRYEEID